MNRPQRTLAAAVAMLSLLLLAPSLVLAQQVATGVYYDYVQISFGGTTRSVLIPRETDAINQNAPLNVSIPAALRVLRDNKQATYGNTSLTLTDEDIAASRAVVHIDPAQQMWFLIITAEVVYTFTELGLTEVVFPSLGDQAWTRDDVPFPAYVMHAPMWRALPPTRLSGGLVELADGELVPASEFYRRWNDGDAELERQLLSLLSEGNAVEQSGVLSALEGLDIPGIRQAVLPLLGHESGAIRLQAIGLLSRDPDQVVLTRLSELIDSDASPEVRAAAAAALGRSEDARFQYFDLVHQLQIAPEAEHAGIIGRLGETGDSRAVEVVMPYVSSPDRQARAAAIEAMVRLGVVGQLLTLMEAADTPIFARLNIAEVLSQRTSGSDALRALESLVRMSDGEAATNVLATLAGRSRADGGSEARQAIERLLNHSNAGVRAQVARTLGELGDLDSLTAIARAAQSEQDAVVARAYDNAASSILMAQPVNQVIDQSQSSSTFVQRAAFLALGRMAQAGRGTVTMRRVLLDGLMDSSVEIRAAAVMGLAGFADAEAFSAIESSATDGDPRVRAALALALGRFPAPTGREILLALVEDENGSVIAAAVEAFGVRLELDQLPQVLSLMTSHPSAEVRQVAAIAVGSLATDQTAQVVIDALMGLTADPEPAVRSAAAASLGRFNNELAVIGLSTLTQDSNPEVKLAAVEALAQTGHSAAVGVLSTLLVESSPRYRIAAYRALAALGLRTAVPVIESALANETDTAAQQAAQQALEQLRQ